MNPIGEHSGGDVNYYQLYIEHPANGAPYWVECEDVIATFDMSFAEGTVLKSLWRSCAERTLGKLKLGGDSVRDAEKIVYYTKQILLRNRRDFEPFATSPRRFDSHRLHIGRPKRNAPCDTCVGDIVSTLGMIHPEEYVLRLLWSICCVKKYMNRDTQEAVNYIEYLAVNMLTHGEATLAHRKFLATVREGHPEEGTGALTVNTGASVATGTSGALNITEGFNNPPPGFNGRLSDYKVELPTNSGALIINADNAVAINTAVPEVPAFLQKEKDS